MSDSFNRMHRVIFSSIATFLVAAIPLHALGQDDTEAQKAFAEGKELLSQGRIAEACAAFERSETLEEAGGTLLNIADCKARQGAFASAVRSLEAAQRLAKRAGRDDAERFIRDELDTMSKKVAHLAVALPSSRPAGLTLRIDGQETKVEGDKTDTPIDAGVHDIEASAPGTVSYRASVRVSGEGAAITIAVPELERATIPSSPAPLIPPPHAPQEHSFPPARRIVGYSMIASGAVATVFGAIFGGVALSRSHRAVALCPHPTCSSADGVIASGEAHSFADVSTALLVSGIAIAGTGFIVAFAPPIPQSSRTTTAVGVGGRW